jgi:3-oxoacyl-[acyl-carrier-protein] synthase II
LTPHREAPATEPSLPGERAGRPCAAPARVVITGMGAVTPVGVGIESFWEALVEGRSGVRPLRSFDAAAYPSRIGAEVPDFEPTRWLERKEARRMDRFAQFAAVATLMAIEDAGLDLARCDRDRVGVVMGTGIGGMTTFDEQFRVLIEKGPDRVSPFFVPMMIANMAAGQISILTGARGPNTTLVTACASSANAVGEAFRIIQRGEADAMLTGGSEAAFVPLTFAGFCAMKALSTRNDDPAGASRPFDAGRDGFVLGEGGGALVLESLEHARARGARVYAELCGYGMSADAHHITAPAPGGEGAVRAMRKCLGDAGLAPEDVDYINAHATSTPQGDREEAAAIRTVFGAHAARLAVSSTKSMTGHLLGAAGAVELIASVLAVHRGVLPPTINYETPDPECDLDCVPNTARRASVRAALSNSFGFGGQNACLLVRRAAGL